VLPQKVSNGAAPLELPKKIGINIRRGSKFLIAH
jgi:hypothetical protein